MRIRLQLIMKLFIIMGIFLSIFNVNAEKSISEIIESQLDEKTVEAIRRQIDIPQDYDVNRAMKRMDYLVMIEGFSVPGAAGLIGNGYAESRLLLNPGKGLYKGLFQWNGNSRWLKVMKYLESNNVDFEDEEELYLWEMSAAIRSEDGQQFEDVIEYCKLCITAEDSANHWCRKFEGVTQALSIRKKIAKLTVQIYELYINLKSEGEGGKSMKHDDDAAKKSFQMKKMVEYIKEKHEGQKRIQNTPYYLHPLAVSNILKEKGFDEEYQVAGLFHDLLEDTDMTYYEVLKISNVNVAEAVRLVTKEPGYNKKDYFSRIKQNDIARMVKLADRVHNLSEAYLASAKFQKKYIQETEEWFLDLARNTVFEEDLKKALENLKNSHKRVMKVK